MWSGNSSDLNLVEKLWFIMKQGLNNQELVANLGLFSRRLKAAWRNISSDTFRDVLASMLSHVGKCAKLTRARPGGFCVPPSVVPPSVLVR